MNKPQRTTEDDVNYGIDPTGSADVATFFSPGMVNLAEQVAMGNRGLSDALKSSRLRRRISPICF